MCGISGIFYREQQPPDADKIAKNMINALDHRGPDGRAMYIDDWVTLGHARLSIIDLEGGQQPLCNEDKSLWLICNGEIFNYIELREELEKRGHKFETNTDVEVILHLFEDYREELLNKINGQYAFAIWDRQNQQLFLARDHVGICPLHYWFGSNKFVFASEIKAIFQVKDIRAQLDFSSLSQIFTFWAPIPGNTAFQNISEIKPGCYMWVRSNHVHEYRYWSPNFGENNSNQNQNTQILTEELVALLDDAVNIRLRSDVPVGAYLSGGLDSSITTALVKKSNKNQLRTFSIGFEDSNFDETSYQQIVSKFLQTDHSYIKCSNKTIGEILHNVIWHTEKPILRTSPAPLFRLSKLVHDSGYKVVLTGEGADEFFSGYNIFKETKLRCFNANQPKSKLRPLLFKKLYPFLEKKDDRMDAFWTNYFQKNFLSTSDVFYSHRLRWQTGVFIMQFFNTEIKEHLSSYEPTHDLSMKLNGDLDALKSLSPLARAHFLETYIFLGNYLLNSQGDRMLMSHSVEGRYPFLDRRVIEYANRLPFTLKLKGLKEKWILKSAFAEKLPSVVVNRIKQPYRAPINELYNSAKDYFSELISEHKLKQDGIFDFKKTKLLQNKIEESPHRVSAREEMAWIAMVTTGILVDAFIKNIKLKTKNDKRNVLVLDYRSKDS